MLGTCSTLSKYGKLLLDIEFDSQSACILVHLEILVEVKTQL